MGHVVIGFAAALLVAVAGMAIGLLSPHDILAWDLTWRNGVLCALAFAFSAASSFFVRGAIATQYALVIACIFIGFLSALLLREGLLSGVIDYRLAGFALWLALLTTALWWQQVVDFWKGRQLGISAILISFVATLVLGTYPAFAWNTLIAAPLNLHTLIVADAPLSATSSGLYDLIVRGDIAINWVTLLLTGVAAAGAYFAQNTLKAILKHLELTPDEVEAAKRLREPVKNTIGSSETLDNFYPMLLHLCTWDPPVDLRLDRKRAIVRIFLSPDTGPERMRSVKATLRRYGSDLKKALIIIYERGFDAGTPPPPILAYGTGEEVTGLFDSQVFISLLENVNAEGIRQFVEQSRVTLLSENPESDVMLSTVYSSTQNSVSRALGIMQRRNLRRMLLVSDREPFEYGVLSTDKLARFLCNAICDPQPE